MREITYKRVSQFLVCCYQNVQGNLEREEGRRRVGWAQQQGQEPDLGRVLRHCHRTVVQPAQSQVHHVVIQYSIMHYKQK